MTTEAVQLADWNAFQQEFIWGEPYSQSISFLLQGNVILVRDQQNSTYTTIGDAYVDDTETAYWDALDEGGRSCLVVMYHIESILIMEVIYDDVAFRYFFEEE
jgi:hypothetical protein